MARWLAIDWPHRRRVGEFQADSQQAQLNYGGVDPLALC